MHYLTPNFFASDLGRASLCIVISIDLPLTKASVTYQIQLYLPAVPQEFFTM